MRLFGLAAMLVAASAAHAGDLELPGPAVVRLQAPPPAEFIWTGCHMGFHLGFDAAAATPNGQFIDNLVPSTFGAPTAVAMIVPPIAVNAISALGGLQGGCDVQVARRLVFGVQGDFSGTPISSSVNVTGNTTLFGFPIPAPTNVSNTGTLNQKIDFTATLTARLGYAYETSGRSLLYLKGGAAWLGARYGFSGNLSTTSCNAFAGGSCQAFNATVVQPFNFGASETRLGWTIGLGWEFAVARNWSAWMEADYLSFPSHNVVFNDPVLPPASVGVSAHVTEIKAGVNYLIGPEQGWRY